MNLWIITIGSSDVQLDSDKRNQQKGRTEKQRSDKVWGYWYTDELQERCDISFEPKPLFKDREELYRIAPRILGVVYNTSSQQVQQEIRNYLTFPLLDNFVQTLEDCTPPEAIAVLLTDQSAIFQDERQRRKLKSPYWQDTCELKPILQGYLEDKFPGIPCKWINLVSVLEDQRLDDWDKVLQLVQAKFSEYFQKELPKNSTVYVSHQASTPAISSAVQFVSLSRFGDRVRFLVSSEQDTRSSEILPSSSYLKGIRKQEALTLLDRHDYSGVTTLIEPYLEGNDDTKVLLEAAIQWNFAKFDEFIKKLKQHPKFTLEVEEREKKENWWWTAYEAAYLGVVRLKQGNTVEAMFHSFRAVEGLLKKWLYEKSGLRVEDGKAQLLREVEFTNKKGDRKRTRSANAYGQGLYFALDSIKCIDVHQYIDIWTFGKVVFDRRNELFHQLGGLQDKGAVFAEWKSPNEEKSLDEQGWKDRVKNCLNFVSDQMFVSIEDASLMVKVHQELERSIANL
jgi:hypothetical protein